MPIGTYYRIEENEIPEFSIRGPFGGIQSEMSPADIEGYGFVDSVNVIFRKGRARMRPGLVSLPSLPSQCLGLFSFEDSSAIQHQVAVTATGLYAWNVNTQSWTQITGTLTGTANQLFTATTVGYKLCFCQGKDNIQMWDGNASSFGPVSSNAFPAYYLQEINSHLVAGYTVEGGVQYPQRVRWSGANDPTDWTSYDSGVADLLGNKGPIAGIGKVGQQGLIIHARGVTQMIPTGIGLAPFDFLPLGASEHGCGFPYTIASVTDLGCAYVAKDDIYIVDPGFNFIPIGAYPTTGYTGGTVQLGARQAIMAELHTTQANQVYAFWCVSINGYDYLSYWIVIPGQSTWVYNYVEKNWTRFTWAKGAVVANRFVNPQVPTIGSLIGTIAQQSWSAASLVGNSPFDVVAICFNDGSVGQLDFTTYSEQPATIVGAQHSFGDRRHTKSLTGMRISYEDLGAVNATVSFASDAGYSDQETAQFGSGTGYVSAYVVRANPKVSGMFHQWRISLPAGSPASFTEFAPLYVTGGEFKNNP